MRLPDKKSVISFLFLVAFLSLRVVNAHAYSHLFDKTQEGDHHHTEALYYGVGNFHVDDHRCGSNHSNEEEEEEDHNCDLCDFLLNTQQHTPFGQANTENLTTITPLFIDQSEPLTAYDAPLQCIATPLSVYNKPPPRNK